MRFPERSRPLYLAAALALVGCEEQPIAPAVQYPAPGPQAYAPQPYPPQPYAPQPYPPQPYPPQPYAPQPYPPQPYPPPRQPYPPGYAPQAQLPHAYPPAPQAYPPRPPPVPPPQGYWPPIQTPPAPRPAAPTPVAVAQPASPRPVTMGAPPGAAPVSAPKPAGVAALPPPPAVPAAPDPINTVDLIYLRAQAKSVLDELIGALPPSAQAKVQGIPLNTDSTVGEVNAYAACNDRQPLMAITDGLLQIEAYTAALRATDEIYGTATLDTYLHVFAKEQKPQQPIVAPPASLLDPAQQVDPRKVARQHQILEELLAFVLGHELAHHYLGHTGCAIGQSGDRPLTLGDGARLVTNIIPMFNQPLEIAADSAGVDDVLAAGTRRIGYHWTELGALLTLGFFGALEPLTWPATAITTFADSHPNPAARIPFIKSEVARYRQTGTWYTPPLPMLP